MEAATNRSTQELAQRHLWMHFTKLGSFGTGHEVPMIVRGEGCYVWDSAGRRYLDGLSGLFTTQVGHGREELAKAAAEQARTLEYFPIWSYAHPTAAELAGRLARLAPGDLDRVYFTNSGSEAVESAWKLARQYFRAIGQPQRHKVISRNLAYHGTTFGALAITGLPQFRAPFEPLTPGVTHVANTNRFRPSFPRAVVEDTEAFAAACADAIEQAIVMEGPETVAAVFLEPVQNAGGCIPPPSGYFERVREICDQHGVLLVSDEVICGFGRLGEMFGCQRHGYQPDLMTVAKGITSGYAPLGAVIASERIAAPFLEEGAMFAHGLTFGGHPVSCAVALANLDVIEGEGLVQNVRGHEAEFRSRLEGLRDIPIVGDVRGGGYFLAIELVADQATSGRFSREQCDAMLRGFLTPALFEAGLICRADSRGEPVIQFAPPLIAGPEHFDQIETTLRGVLSEAATRFGS